MMKQTQQHRRQYPYSHDTSRLLARVHAGTKHMARPDTAYEDSRTAVDSPTCPRFRPREPTSKRRRVAQDPMCRSVSNRDDQSEKSCRSQQPPSRSDFGRGGLPRGVATLALRRSDLQSDPAVTIATLRRVLNSNLSGSTASVGTAP